MKTVFITGVSSGIGRACADMFLEHGWKVAGTSRSGSEIPGISVYAMDLSDPASIVSSIEKAFSEERIDLFVQCAGSGTAGAFEDFSDEQLSGEINVLFLGASRVIKQAITCMRGQGGGRIIVIGSVAGRIPLPYQDVYSACKAALFSLVSAVRLEVAQFGIDMCVVEPGDTKTGFTSARKLTDKNTYGRDRDRAIAQFEHDEINGVSPKTAASAVYAISQKKKIRARYAVCLKYKLLCFIFGICPGPVRDFALRALYF